MNKLIVHACSENFLISPDTFVVKLKIKQNSCCPYSSFKWKLTTLTAYLSDKILSFFTAYFDMKSSKTCLPYAIQRERQNRITSPHPSVELDNFLIFKSWFTRFTAQTVWKSLDTIPKAWTILLLGYGKFVLCIPQISCLQIKVYVLLQEVSQIILWDARQKYYNK